jgi:hypothetical protein
MVAFDTTIDCVVNKVGGELGGGSLRNQFLHAKEKGKESKRRLARESLFLCDTFEIVGNNDYVRLEHK